MKLQKLHSHDEGTLLALDSTRCTEQAAFSKIPESSLQQKRNLITEKRRASTVVPASNLIFCGPVAARLASAGQPELWLRLLKYLGGAYFVMLLTHTSLIDNLL